MPLNFNFGKNERKVGREQLTFEQARTQTRKLDPKDVEKVRIFDSILNPFIEKYSKHKFENDYQSFLAQEKFVRKLKNYIEITTIRGLPLDDNQKEIIRFYSDKFKIDSLQKNKIDNLITTIENNKSNLDDFCMPFLNENGELNQAKVFYYLTKSSGKALTLDKFSSIKIRKGPIGFEISGSSDDINKFYAAIGGNGLVGGFAFSCESPVNGKNVPICLNFFIDGAETSYAHELQHNLNDLLKINLQSKKIVDPEIILRLIAKNPNDQKDILKLHYISLKNQVLNRFGDELLAQLRGGATFTQIRSILLSGANQSVSYQFTKPYEIFTTKSIDDKNQSYYYSKEENRAYAVSGSLTDEMQNLAKFEKIVIDEKANVESRLKYLIKSFDKDTRQILDLVEFNVKRGRATVNELIDILSLTPLDSWIEKLQQIKSLRVK